MVVLDDSDLGALSNFEIDDDIIERLKERNIEYLFPVQYKTYESIFSGKDAVVLARSALRSGVQVVVGAPGRVIDLIDKGVLKLNKISYVVLDEVDRMLDMGFSKNVERIFTEIYNKDSENHKNPQTLLFSATMPSWVSSIAKKYLSPDVFNISLINKKEMQTSTNVQHLAILCPYDGRASTLSDVIRVYCKTNDSRCIVFCERKKDADELSSHDAMSSDCHVFHGDVPQDKRELILQKFREGKYRTLLTTNVAARGLDVPSVDLVIQCHPPKDIDDYIHRSGRTGRASRLGVSICFYTARERDHLMLIEKRAGFVFRRISPPTVQDVANIWGQEMVDSFNSVPKSTWSTFIPLAQSIAFSLSKEKDSSNDIINESKEHLDDPGQLDDDDESLINSKKRVKSKTLLHALCCALARLSGKDGQIESRSALTAQKEMTAYKLDLEWEAQRKGLAFALLRNHLPEDIVNSVKSLSFIKGKKGFVFDLPSVHAEVVKKSWPDSELNKLSLLTEIPNLEPEFSDQQSNFHGGGRSFGFNSRGGGGRGRGGFGGRGGHVQHNWQRDRPMKRSFNHDDFSQTTRTEKWSKSSN